MQKFNGFIQITTIFVSSKIIFFGNAIIQIYDYFNKRRYRNKILMNLIPSSLQHWRFKCLCLATTNILLVALSSKGEVVQHLIGIMCKHLFFVLEISSICDNHWNTKLVKIFRNSLEWQSSWQYGWLIRVQLQDKLLESILQHY
jgi:hypothetical protein